MLALLEACILITKKCSYKELECINQHKTQSLSSKQENSLMKTFDGTCLFAGEEWVVCNETGSCYAEQADIECTIFLP